MVDSSTRQRCFLFRDEVIKLVGLILSVYCASRTFRRSLYFPAPSRLQTYSTERSCLIIQCLSFGNSKKQVLVVLGFNHTSACEGNTDEYYARAKPLQRVQDMEVP
jgi:hypothetical protein